MAVSVSNTLLTIDMITREALRLFLNSNAFLKSVRKTYDNQFARSGAKIGTTLRIRKPNDFTVGSGSTVTPQGTNEQQVTLTVATQKNVAMAYTSADKALKLDDFSDNILRPAINALAGAVSADVIGAANDASNFVSKIDGSNNIVSPDLTTFVKAGAVLNQLECPQDERIFIVDPVTQGNAMSSLSGLFNNPTKISKQYDDGSMDGMAALGFLWKMDQLTPTHTTGAYVGNIHVDSASQTGQTLLVKPLTGPVKKGDIFTIANVYMVNRTAKVNTGSLNQFVVTADAATSDTTLLIYPAIVPPSGSDQVQYQTVTTSPASNAAITFSTMSGEQYRRNFVLHPSAVQMVTADLQLPSNAVMRASRQQFAGVSMRYIEDYIFLNDLAVSRIDILYGWKTVRNEWMCVVADKI